MDDDYSLLQRYVRERSDAAFETLMQRHADLVYSSALRLTSDPHLAEDVTQAVFIVLARKAPQLKANVVLPAWLLSVTKLTAANARRDKNRQHRHEQENATLNANRDSTNRSGGEWLQLAPMLDGALEQLSESDRAAVVLRYFKRCSIGELAAQLHVSEAAADKRVLRALEKLRGFLTKRGLTLSALGLAVLLTENSVHAAPPTLATVFPQVLAAAHGGIHVSNGVVLANGALKAMSIVSTKQLAACAAIFLCLGVAGGLSVKYWNARPAVTAGALAPTITDRKEWPLPDQAPDTDGVRVENPPAPTPIPAVVAVPPANQEVPVAAGGPPETLQPANNQSVNMLALANAAADSINGVWSIAGGELVTHERTAFARFEFPFIPPGEYDFKLDFTVLEARGDVAMILAKNGKQFVWKMGALGNHVNAFESIGTIGDQNHTRRTYPKVFEKDKRYQAVVQVRDRWVAAYFNGKLESWHATDYTDFDFYKFWKLPHPDTLGVGVWATSIQVHSAELAEMPGGAHCRALREPGEQPTPREQPQLTDEKLWANAVNLLPLIDPNRDAVTGRWSLSANGLDCLKTPTARLEIPYQPPAEYDFKIVFTRQAGGEDIHQFLNLGGRAGQWCMNERRSGISSAFHCLTGSGWEGNNPTTVMGGYLANDQRHTSIVQVRKGSMAAFVDGSLISSWSDGFDGIRLLKAWKMPTPGLLGLGSNNNATVFQEVEILEITGKGRIVPANPKRIPELEPTPIPAPPPKKAPEVEGAF